MKILDVTVDENKLYNPELKIAYLKDYEGTEGSKRGIYFDFVNSGKIESQYDKDLYAFNDIEVSNLLRSIGFSSDMAMRRTLSNYKTYVDWCISNGQRGKYESGVNYIEIFQNKADLTRYISNRKIRNKILSKSEIEDVIDALVNPVDKALIYSFYNLIGGKAAYEIRSLKKNDIDATNRIVKLTSEDGGVRYLKPDERLLNLLLSAAEQEKYVIGNDEISWEGKNLGLYDLNYTDYVFRQVYDSRVSDGMMSYTTLNQKFQSIKKYTGYDFISPKSIKNSRLIHEVIDITEKKGIYIANKEVFDELNMVLKEKFNTQLSSMQLYNLEKLYYKVIDIKEFD